MAKKAMVSDDLREAIKREVRAEVYESIMETNKNRAGAKVSKHSDNFRHFSSVQ